MSVMRSNLRGRCLLSESLARTRIRWEGMDDPMMAVAKYRMLRDVEKYGNMCVVILELDVDGSSC